MSNPSTPLQPSGVACPQGERPAVVFYPIGHPSPFVYGSRIDRIDDMDTVGGSVDDSRQLGRKSIPRFSEVDKNDFLAQANFL
jgi:hypothetical protein